jgi:hypothetical protein
MSTELISVDLVADASVCPNLTPVHLYGSIDQLLMSVFDLCCLLGYAKPDEFARRWIVRLGRENLLLRPPADCPRGRGRPGRTRRYYCTLKQAMSQFKLIKLPRRARVEYWLIGELVRLMGPTRPETAELQAVLQQIEAEPVTASVAVTSAALSVQLEACFRGLLQPILTQLENVTTQLSSLETQVTSLRRSQQAQRAELGVIYDQLTARGEISVGRKMVNQVLRRYAKERRLDYRAVWRELYRRLYLVSGHDWQALARCNYRNGLAEVEFRGWLSRLQELLMELIDENFIPRENAA